MDQGGNLPGTVGVGPDLTFGTFDDEDVDFISDVYAPGEGFSGTEDTLSLTAFGLTHSNYSPTIDTIDARELSSIVTVDIPLTIADPDDPVDALEVSVISSDDLVLPAFGLQLSGGGGNRILSITPSGRAGVSSVTVTVSDGVGETAGSFDVTYTHPPPPPPSSKSSGSGDSGGGGGGSVGFHLLFGLLLVGLGVKRRAR